MSFIKINPSQIRGPWVPAPAKSSTSVALDSIMNSSKKVGHANRGFILPLPLLNASSSSSYGSLKYSKQIPVSVTKSNPAMRTKSGTSSTTGVSNQIPGRSRREGSSSKQVIIRKPTSRLKTKYGGRRPSASYKLQSKDSLVDVTACLQAKRAEVMKIWERNLLRRDEKLLSLIESANRLALEAAEEVEMLRRTIQDFQRKEDGLTDADCASLNEMRKRVLLKVSQFEEVDNELHEIIAKKSASASESRTSVISAISKPSQTEADSIVPPEENRGESEVQIQVEEVPSSHSLKDVLILKDKPENVESSHSEDDIKDRRRLQEKVRVASEPNVPATARSSTAASVSASLENLNHLKKLYEENLTFPQIEIEEFGVISRSQSCGNVGFSQIKTENFKVHHHNHHHPHLQQQPRSARFQEQANFKSDTESHHDNIRSSQSMSSSNTNELYQQKISRLQRKLMGTEQELEELKSEMERIESDANFRVRMLQNSVQDKFDSLAVIPEFLQMAELKISEAVQAKTKLQDETREKDRIISEEKETNSRLRRETEELREKLRLAESSKEMLTMKNYELEKSNAQLRKEIDDMANKYTDLAAIMRETDSFTSPRSPRSRPSSANTNAHHQNQNWEVQKLKLQCSELKDKLSQSKRIIQSIRKSKEKMAAGLNEKIEELMDALQEAQQHKRVLGDQIRFLKKSYHDLFPSPVDLFTLGSSQKKPMKAKGHRHRSRSKRKPVPVVEPKFESKVTWQTGTKKAGDSIMANDNNDFVDSSRDSSHAKNNFGDDVATPSENDETN